MTGDGVLLFLEIVFFILMAITVGIFIFFMTSAIISAKKKYDNESQLFRNFRHHQVPLSDEKILDPKFSNTNKEARHKYYRDQIRSKAIVPWSDLANVARRLDNPDSVDADIEE